MKRSYLHCWDLSHRAIDPQETQSIPYMTQKVKRPIPSISSQVVGTCAALTMLSISISSGVVAAIALVNGHIYSATVVLGINKMVSKSSSPSEYWTTVVLCVLCCIVGTIVAMTVLREVVVDHKRKIEARKNRDAIAEENETDSMTR